MKALNEKAVDVCLGLSSTLVLLGIVLKYQFAMPIGLEENIEAIITQPLNTAFNSLVNTYLKSDFMNAWNGFVVEYSSVTSTLIGIGLTIISAITIHRLRQETPKERNEFIGFIVCALTGFLSLWSYSVFWGWVETDSSLIGWIALLGILPFAYGSVFLAVYCLTKTKIFEKSTYYDFVRESRLICGIESKKTD